MITEHDLTQSLSRLADEDAQPDEFRQRIDLAVTAHRRRPMVRRIEAVLAVAACVVVIAALGLALTVLVSHGHKATQHPTTHRNRNVVAAFSGIGNATHDVPAAQAPTGREVTFDVSCRGTGQLRVNDYFVRSCSGGASGGFSDGGRTTPSQLRVITGATVSWHVSVRFEINYRSNGIVEHPADPLLRRTRGLAHASGTDTGTVHIGAPPGTRRLNIRVLVACTGSGLTLSSSAPGFDGNYTRTCEPNTTYAFDIARVRLPTDFTVSAAGSTTWHLVVLSQ